MVVAEIDGKPQVDTSAFQPPMQSASADGAFNLSATQALLEGGAQVESDTQAIGFWSSTEDRVGWDVKVTTPGKYKVELEYACEPAAAGGKVELDVKGEGNMSEKVITTVSETAGWRQFSTMVLGNVMLPSGRVSLQFKALSINGGGLMNLRKVTLTPVQ